ncbi:MAG: M24 family metallopeptidase, partial [Actinobacteria bacterium]|nr:M24 family metallopeptidase [Actinomycetota bacterium]
MAFKRTIYKTPAQLRQMVAPGRATAASLDAVAEAISVGMSTLQLDEIAEAAIEGAGGRSNFKLEAGYHHTICASVNDEVVHG